MGHKYRRAWSDVLRSPALRGRCSTGACDHRRRNGLICWFEGVIDCYRWQAKPPGETAYPTTDNQRFAGFGEVGIQPASGFFSGLFRERREIRSHDVGFPAKSRQPWLAMNVSISFAIASGVELS
jgi:hypothetical protein